MLKCVGVRRKNGNMTDDNGKYVEWDSVRFSLINDHAPYTEGLHCEVIKIKKEDFTVLTGMEYDKYHDFVNKYVDIDYFNDDGTLKICSFRLSDQQQEPVKK